MKTGKALPSLARQLTELLALPPNIALMHLLLRARDADDARRAIAAALEHCERRGDSNGAARLGGIAQLWERHSNAFSLVQAAVLDHADSGSSPQGAIGEWAARFDRLAGHAPEAGVALYSLGSPELLTAATAEIAGYLRSHDLLGRDRTVLDNGCGIGRMAAALAPEVGHITGIDISAEMLRLARERCAGLANADFAQCSGTDLAGFTDASFDLVLAVDMFPYLFLAGADLVGHQVTETARVLKAAGVLAILNFSYRNDLAADCADIAGLAQQAGFDVAVRGARPFTLWDGLAFLLRKRAL